MLGTDLLDAVHYDPRAGDLLRLRDDPADEQVRAIVRAWAAERARSGDEPWAGVIDHGQAVADTFAERSAVRALRGGGVTALEDGWLASALTAPIWVRVPHSETGAAGLGNAPRYLGIAARALGVTQDEFDRLRARARVVATESTAVLLDRRVELDKLDPDWVVVVRSSLCDFTLSETTRVVRTRLGPGLAYVTHGWRPSIALLDVGLDVEDALEDLGWRSFMLQGVTAIHVPANTVPAVAVPAVRQVRAAVEVRATRQGRGMLRVLVLELADVGLAEQVARVVPVEPPRPAYASERRGRFVLNVSIGPWTADAGEHRVPEGELRTLAEHLLAALDAACASAAPPLDDARQP